MLDPPPEVLARVLATLPAFAGIAAGDLVPLRRKGLAHRHWLIGATRQLLRVPTRSQLDLAPAANLAQQVASFGRAAPSGRTPALHAVIPPGPDLPFGALVIEEIVGRPPRLPGDAPALAATLAAIHAAPLPEAAARLPLADPPNPFAAALSQVARLLAESGGTSIANAAAAEIADEHAWVESFARDGARRLPPPPKTLIVTDAHPGNFLIAGEHAVFLDLEKAQYGCPAMDLAHASLRPSARWDPDCDHVWTAAETAGFVAGWCAAAGPSLAAAVQPWLLPYRRLVWLRTTAMYWRRLSREDVLAPLEPGVARHAAAIMADALDPLTIAAVRAEWLATGS
jgi:hypothetical protein